MARRPVRPPTKAEIEANIAEAVGLKRQDVQAVFAALDYEIEKWLGKSGSREFVIPGVIKIQVDRTPAARCQRMIRRLRSKAGIPQSRRGLRMVTISPLFSIPGVVNAKSELEGLWDRSRLTGRRAKTRVRAAKPSSAKAPTTKKPPSKVDIARVFDELMDDVAKKRGGASPFGIPGLAKTKGKPDKEPKRGDKIRNPFKSVGQDQPSQRYLRARFPESVVLHQECRLFARVVVSGGNGTAPLRPFQIPAAGAPVELTLHAPGFRISSPQTQTCLVPASGDSDPVPFDLIAQSEQAGPLEITAFYQGTYLGLVEVSVRVMKSGKSVDPKDHDAEIGGGRKAENTLTLHVWYLDDTNYWVQLHEPKRGGAGDPKPGKLKQPRDRLVTSLINQLDKLARGEDGYSDELADRYFRALGVQLWNELLPDDVSTAFLKVCDKYQEVNILSSGDPIPWEAMRPPVRKGERAFLAERFDVTRMLKRYRVDSAEFCLQRAIFVVSQQAPPEALDEISHIIQALTAKGITCARVDRLDDLFQAFDDRNFDLIHFACHNDFAYDGEDLDTARIDIGGQPFTPTLLNDYEGKFARQPLVFMNACTSGQSAPKFTAMSGWAIAFRAAGAGGFIGTLWEVRDKSSTAFARKWYDSMVEAQTVAESFKAARAEVDSADPTRYAFTAYLNPMARFVFS
jgi:hypothetical protein